jgi:hypothetical protein
MTEEIAKRKMPTREERMAARTAALDKLAEDEKALAIKRKQLQEQIEALRDPKAAREKVTRKANHLKILIGACIQDRLKKGLLSEDDFKSWMSPFVKGPDDRKDFGLPDALDRPEAQAPSDETRGYVAQVMAGQEQ